MKKILTCSLICLCLCGCELWFGVAPEKVPVKIEVTQTADVIKDTTGFIMSDSVDCIDLAMPEVEWIIFVGNDDKNLMKFNTETGEIYWKDRLVITDKELVEGLRNIIQENRCPECKKRK